MKITNGHGETVRFVAVYAIDRCYGGPEEGGWWYDTGDLVEVVVCLPYEVDQVKDDLSSQYPFTRKRYSVNGGEDYDLETSDTFPPEHFPESIPHYE
jgi:hypothetical protein